VLSDGQIDFMNDFSSKFIGFIYKLDNFNTNGSKQEKEDS
jgi:hypothetical protein